MTLNAQRYLLAWLMLVIAGSAAFAAINVPTAVVPRAIFTAMMFQVLVLVLVLIFNFIYRPLRDRNYPSLLPHGIVIILFSYSVIKLSITGFDMDDEIYSWNMWAIQHFQGQSADFQFTKAPYPQLFPYWIAALYHALDSITLHSVPRFFLAFPTLILGMAVVSLARISSWRMAAVVSLILIIAFGPVAVRLAKGLADPLMSAAIILSVMMLIAYARAPQKLGLLWLSVACAVIASLTKQAGLIWVCFSLPVTVAIGCWRYNWPRQALMLAVAAMLISLIWPIWIAPTFSNNPGVISASMGSRSYFQQIEFSVNEYMIRRPEILLLFIISVLAAWRHTLLRLLLFVAFFPMLLAWFIFGAYEIRLGIHVLALAALLSICALTVPAPGVADGRCDLEPKELPHRLRAIFLAAAIMAGICGALLFGVLTLAAKIGTDLTDGAKTTLRVQWGSNAGPIFDRILNEKARVWTASIYSYGTFFGRLPVGLPVYSAQPYTILNVKKDLLSFEADYAVQSRQVPFGPASEFLNILAKKCPDALLPVLQPPNQKDFILYKVDRRALSKESCA